MIVMLGQEMQVMRKIKNKKLAVSQNMVDEIIVYIISIFLQPIDTTFNKNISTLHLILSIG